MNSEEPAAELNAREGALLIGGGFIVFLGLNPIGRTLLNGPAYLFVFAFLWVVLMVGHSVVRRFWRDSWRVSGVAALILAGIAISRYWWGVQHGLRRWNYLIIMTIVGCATFFLRSSTFEASSNGTDSGSNWWTSSSCGSSSGSSCGGGGGGGGGGCGGGGCGGGCGGCGGG
jgi:hypothetical protein